MFGIYLLYELNAVMFVKIFSPKWIQTVINYPVALPFLKAYEYQKNQSTDFPTALRHQDEILSLPIYPEMTTEMVNTVSSAISNAFGGLHD